MANKNKIIGQAQKYITKGQWDKAVKELQKLVAEDPNDVRTLLKLGDVYSKKGDRENATKVYKQVAESYSDQGFFLKAVAVYKQILKHDPKHLQVTLKLAELYEHLGLTSEAMAQYHRASLIQEEQGKSKEGLDVLRRMVDLDAENVASRIKLAETFSRENMLPEAIGEFEKAADVLRKQNRIDDYIKVAERLVYHDQSRLDVIKDLARLYLERGDAKRGLAKLQICFKAEPRDVETLKMLSHAFTSLGQHQKTIFVFKELARVYHEEGKVGEAGEVLQQILQLDPNDQDARALLAGDVSSSRPTTQAPLSISPPILAPVLSPSPPPAPPPSPQSSPMLTPSLSPRPTSLGAIPAVNEWSVPSQPGYPFGASPSASSPPAARTPSLAPRPPPPGEEEPRPKPGKPAGPRNAARDSSQISKILTETEVYIKYGLREKALSHLRRVFDLDSDNVEAFQKMRDIYRSIGDNARAAEAIANIMHVHHRRGELVLMEAARADLAKVVPSHPLVSGGIPGSLPAPPQQARRDLSDEFQVEIEDESSEVFELVDEVASQPLGDEPLDVDGSSISVPIRSDDLLEEAASAFSTEAATDKGGRPLIEDLETPIVLSEDELPEANSGIMMLSDVETGAELEAIRPSFAEEEEEEEQVEHEVDPFAGNERSEVTARAKLEDARREEAKKEVTDRSDLASLFAKSAQANARREITMREEIEEPAFVDDDTEGGASIDLTNDMAKTSDTGMPEEEAENTDLLDEAEFLIEAGLAEEARDAVQSILSESPDDPRALEMLSRVEELEREVAAESEQEDDDDKTGSLPDQPAPGTLPLDNLPLPEEDGTSPEDRYDQGMLFKDLGRVDEAIKEFRSAAKNAGRELQSLEMIGHCLLEKGNAKDAVAYFSRALERGSEGISATNLKYEIGNAYEAAGDPEGAREWFTQCYQDDPDHRDVKDRVDRLGGPRPPGGGNGAKKQNGISPEASKAPSSKKSKISYL